MQLLVYIFNFQINESPFKKRMHNKNAFEIKKKMKNTFYKIPKQNLTKSAILSCNYIFSNIFPILLIFLLKSPFQKKKKSNQNESIFKHSNTCCFVLLITWKVEEEKREKLNYKSVR